MNKHLLLGMYICFSTCRASRTTPRKKDERRKKINALFESKPSYSKRFLVAQNIDGFCIYSVVVVVVVVLDV